MPPPLPFFSSRTVRLLESNGHVRIHGADSGNLLAVQSWRLLAARAESDALIVQGVFGDLAGDPTQRVVRPLAPEDATGAARALMLRYALPRSLEVVPYESLASAPQRFDGRHIEATGVWRYGFEVSSFAGAWLTGPFPVQESRAWNDYRVLVRGVWRSQGRGFRYGHLGASSAALDAYVLTVCP